MARGFVLGLAPLGILKTYYLFAVSDIPAVTLPAMAIALAIAGPCSWQRITFALLWVQLHLLPFQVKNQLNGIDEDRMAKPYRPLPSGRITVGQATLLHRVSFLLMWAAAFQANTVACTLVYSIAIVSYNEGGLSEFAVPRNLVGALGIGCYCWGTTTILGMNPPMNDVLAITAVILMGHAQDFRDRSADQARGRTSIPLLLSQPVARWSLAAISAAWTVGLILLWQPPVLATLAYVTMGVLYTAGFLSSYDEKDDYYSYCWYGLPERAASRRTYTSDDLVLDLYADEFIEHYEPPLAARAQSDDADDVDEEWESESDPRDDIYFNLLQSWLAACSMQEQCAGMTSALMPKRVLEISKDASANPKLLVTNGELEQYIVLSHCWGSAEPSGKLKDSLIPEYQQGLNLDPLPQNVQVAVHITRRLGFRYLWIDALCISHDNAEDRAEEKAKLPLYYGQAALIVSASTATGTDPILLLLPLMPTTTTMLVDFVGRKSRMRRTSAYAWSSSARTRCAGLRGKGSEMHNALRQTIRGGSYTISDLLEVPNPIFDIRAGAKMFPLQNTRWVQISDGHITRLNGFTNTNFDEIYEDFLSQTGLPTSDYYDDCHLLSAYNTEGIVVRENDEFDSYLGLWLAHNALYCINKTAPCLPDRLGTSRKKYRLTRGYEFHYQDAENGRPRRSCPDWAFIYRDFHEPEGVVDLAGETKKVFQMNPADIEKIKPNLARPIPFRVYCATLCLRQCATYAWNSRCRYAFLLTAEHVIIFRFHLVRKGKSTNDKFLGVEYDYFPYPGEENLDREHPTLCKAIWSLVMMAQNAQHRDIVPLGEMLPLDTWYIYMAAPDRAYYVHHISEIIRDTIPSNTPPDRIVNISRAPREALWRILGRINILLGRAPGHRRQDSKDSIPEAQNRPEAV
ncbi:hypothetical protein PG984_005691 [Apiospora sp. TS-2023a]